MTHGAIREYGPLRLMHGCAPRDEFCSGPDGAYWTLFGSELVMLLPHAALALLLGAFAGILSWRRARAAGRPAAPVRGAGAAALAAAAAFLLLAWVAPMRVLY